MNLKRITLGIIGALLTVAALVAQPPANRMEKRADQQQKRIAQGVKSRTLTAKETVKLERRETKIQRHIVKAKADGRITKGEAMKIKHEQNKASRKIFQKKHNAHHQ